MVTDVNWTYCGDHFAMCSCVCSVTQLCPTLCAPMDCVAHQTPLSVHGIFQARMLEWVAISFSRGSSRPRGQTYISCIGRQVLYHWATWEAASFCSTQISNQYAAHFNALFISIILQLKNVKMENFVIYPNRNRNLRMQTEAIWHQNYILTQCV